MNNSLFIMSIKEAAKVCEDCGVLKSYIRPSSFNVVKPDIKNFSDYKTYVNELLIRGEYDILLSDDSLFQFEINLNKSITVDGKKVKYDYYKYTFAQASERRLGFDEYMEGIDRSSPDYNEELYREMYENDSPLGENYSPFYIRYDVDYKGYLPNSHSYAHMHLGFKEGYRMPVSLILTPKAFVCMVLKLVYSTQWKEKIISDSGTKARTYSALKTQCLNEPNKYWTSEERVDLYIG